MTTIKVAHVADTHITERGGDSRATLEEQVEILRWIGEDAKEAGAKLLVHAGDLYDAASTPAERLAAVEVVASWADRMPVVIVQGNHDRALDLGPLARLRARNSIIVAESPRALTVAGCSVACLPWPRKAGLVAMMAGASALEVQTALGDALRSVLLGLRMDLEAFDGPRILLAHVELGGARLDSGQPVAARCDVPLSEGDLLDVGADYCALGHIHAHQTIGDRLCYSGSPRQCTFGEDRPKGYVLATVERGVPPVIEFRAAPGRRLVTIEAEWVGSNLGGDGDHPQDVNRLVSSTDAVPSLALAIPVIRGAAVRLSYHVEESDRAAAAQDAESVKALWLAAGAHSVKLDPRVEVTSRVRSEEIRTAKTTADRVEAWWGAKGQRPGRAAEILGKLSNLEAEVQS